MVTSLLLFMAVPLWFIASKVLSLKARLALCITLSLPQIYLVGVGDSYISLAALCALLLVAPDTINSKAAVRDKSIRVLILMLLYQLFSLLWASDYKLGLKVCSVSLIFLATYAGAYKLSGSNPKALLKILSYFGYSLFAASLSTILFRLNPDLESTYLNSTPAKLFLGNGFVVGLESGDLFNNILDPEKSAGLFFANANVAAGYLGISAFVVWYVAKTLRSPVLKLSAILALAAVFFTGSKSAVMLAVALSVTATVLAQKHEQRGRKLLHYNLLMLALVVMLGAGLVFSQVLLDFGAEAGGTSASRYYIWSFAGEEFKNHPILGQGFGGWSSGFSNYAEEGLENFVPHNTLINLWSQSGLLAPILGLIFMYYVLSSAFRLMKIGSKDDHLLGLSVAMASVWLFGQGMGENWGLVGEAHQEILIAAMLAMVHFRLNSCTTEVVPISPEGVWTQA